MTLIPSARKVLVVAGTAGLLISIGFTGPAIAAPLPTPTSDAHTSVASKTTSQSSGSQFVWTADTSPAGLKAAAQRADSGQARAASAAQAQTWAGCGVWADQNKVVRTFGNSKVLRCGNVNYGYWHIYNNHRSEFDQKAALTNQNWREVADIGMSASISNSEVTKPRSSNDTTCYSRKIFLVNLQSHQTVGSVIVRTVVGNRSNNVVTAFPSSGYCTGSE